MPQNTEDKTLMSHLSDLSTPVPVVLANKATFSHRIHMYFFLILAVGGRAIRFSLYHMANAATSLISLSRLASGCSVTDMHNYTTPYSSGMGRASNSGILEASPTHLSYVSIGIRKNKHIATINYSYNFITTSPTAHPRI